MKTCLREYVLSDLRNPDHLNHLLEQAYQYKKSNSSVKIRFEVIDDKVTVWIV